MSFIDARKFKEKFSLEKIGPNQYITADRSIEFRPEFTEGFKFNPPDLPYMINRSSYYLAHYLRHLYAINRLSVSNGIVVDFGCGEAFDRSLIHKGTYIGRTHYVVIDAHYPSLKKAAEIKHGSFLLIHDHIVGDATYINDETIDLVIALDIIEHMDEKQGDAFLEGIHRILKPGGKLVLSTPNVGPGEVNRDFHVREYSLEEIMVKLSGHFVVSKVVGWNGSEKGSIEKFFTEEDRAVFNRLKGYVKPALLRQVFVGMYPELASNVIYDCIKTSS